jgi:hypothetical protein
MIMSSMSRTMKRTSEVLKLGASRQVLDYEKRFSSIQTLYDDLLSNLIRMEFSAKDACETAEEFFKTTTVPFAGIDGTMYSRPLFDLVIFFGGAYASTGTVNFRESGPPTISYDMKTLKQAAGISSVVPVYINEIPEIDHSFFEAGQYEETSLIKPLTDQSIIDNATIANWIMTFAEYYLAYRLATDPSEGTRIILMDRSLSIERASLIYDTAKRDLWKKRCSLIGYKTDDGEPLDVNDFTIARQCICNQPLGLPSPRGDYLNYAIIQAVKQRERLNETQVLAELKATEEKRAKRVRRYLKRLVSEDILMENDGTYALNPKFANTKERIKNLITNLGDQFFFNKMSERETSAIMKTLKDGKEQWLTTIDIAFLTLFTLQLLIEECWEKRVLLVGMTKDTAARDFKRQLIPVMHNEQMLNKSVSNLELDRLPNTDRMILQSASLLKPEKMKPPWSLIEYDSVFRTIVPDLKSRKGYISGAIKNRMSLEKLFLKTYVQLSQAKTDPMLRSNVLLTDRLVYPEYDYKPENIVCFLNEFGGAEEPVEVLLYRDKRVPNKIQNMLITILVAMAPSNIPEAFGHNKPLFIADKIAKWNYSQFKSVVDTTATWILNNHKLRRFIFYMSTFRERRATIEAARREQT